MPAPAAPKVPSDQRKTTVELVPKNRQPRKISRTKIRWIWIKVICFFGFSGKFLLVKAKKIFLFVFGDV